MKKYIFKLMGIITILIFLLQANFSIAATTTELNNEKEQNKQEIEEKNQQKEEIQAKKNATVEEIEQISTQIQDYENQINELDTKITDLNNKIQESETKIQKAQGDYNKQEELLEARLVANYEAGETSFLDVLLSSDSITDLISNYYLVTEIATNDAELLEKIENEKEEIEKAKQELENSKKELDTSKAQKQSVSVQLQSSKAEKDQYVTKLTADEQAIQSQIDELNEANKSIDAEIRQKEAEMKRKLEEYKKQQNNSSGSNGGTSVGGGPTSSSGFIYPVPSAYSRITTGINYSSGQYHGAVDFGSGGINGQPVYAVADGIVYTAKALTTSYGNYVIIMHDNGLFTLYAHGQAGSIRVSEGQRVKQGQQIMNVGSTGNSTGPHLHFEVRVSPGTYNCRRNPMNYLP